MNVMNWDSLHDRYCELQGCSTAQLAEVVGASNKKRINELTRKRHSIARAVQAVKSAYEANPGASREELKTKAYTAILGSTLLLFLAQVVIPAIIKLAIEWLLNAVQNPSRD